MARYRQVRYWLLVGGLAVCFMLGGVSSSTAAEDPPEQLVVGYQAVPNAETVVKDLGWLEADLGIPVRWVRHDSGRHVTRALAAGEVDVGLVGTSPCAEAIARGVPIEVIWIHDVIGDAEALVVQQKSNIDDIQGLVGKRLSAPFGSTTHYHAMVALKLANVDAARLELVNLEPDQMPGAWEQGQIDAAFIWEPVLSVLKEAGAKVLMTSRQLAERGFPTADLCVVRTAFANRYPSTVIQYLRTLDRGVALCRSDPGAAAESVARQLNTTPEKALEQMRGLMLLTGEEQIAGKYMGDLQFHFGLYSLLKETADFLETAEEIEASPPWPVFMRAVNPAFIQRALDTR